MTSIVYGKDLKIGAKLAIIGGPVEVIDFEDHESELGPARVAVYEDGEGFEGRITVFDDDTFRFEDGLLSIHN